jgi:4-hydroxy-3-methylbut-2-enyl diphosphate reductase
MIVIGARHSANSVHLAEICREHCQNVQFIASAEELDVTAFENADTIGVTAGASTPAWIIKEVQQTMTDELKIEETTAPGTTEEAVPEAEMTFDQMLEDSIKTIYNGDTVTGIVDAITPTEISVDLGAKQSGYIPVSEFTDDADAALDQLIKIGDTIEACVVRVNDVEGTVMLSKRRLDAAKAWTMVEEAFENAVVLEGTVTEDNKGGVVASVRGVRVFVPNSQTGLPKDADMSALLKKKVRLKITEVNRGRRRVVGSISAVAKDERRERAEKIWSEIEVGKRYQGIVKSLTGYGVFVDIGGIDGMIHVSELSWSRIRQPSDIMNVGDTVDVYVISFDKENRRISLGYKDPDGNPWEKFMSVYKAGDQVNVKIVKLMPFGAFAEVIPGVDGLIHISQIAARRIIKPDEVLAVGQTADVRITAVDTDKQKISLSIRALLEPEKKAETGAESAVCEAPEAGDAVVYEVSENGEATGDTPETGEE